MKPKRLLFFAILFVILILTPLGLNIYYNYLLQPASTSQDSQLFIVKPGQPIVQIGGNLQKAQLIKSAFAFRLYVAQSGIEKAIQAGDFRLSPNLSTREIAKELTHGAIDIWITFPEGSRLEEMAEIIDSKLKTPNNEKYQFAKKDFLSLGKEGYMFPDTYLIPKDADARQVVDRLSQTFSEKVDAKTLEKGLKNNLSQDEVIILASLIEREAKTNEERPVIAGILLNRRSLGIALQVDATVQYAKGYDASSDSWWPQVTIDDYRLVKSPYNTYLHPGLPSAPIASPGLQSIRAAAEPQETDYLYYLHDSEGKIHYAKTAEEHNANIQNYL